MNFNNFDWEDTKPLRSKKFICWNCGNLVASTTGYTALQNGVCRCAGIYICPHCKAPHLIDNNNEEMPSALPGKTVKKLPENINQIYEEARNCIAAGANTATVMILRKILMNLAVQEGATEGDSFAHYVEYLCINGFIHRRQQEQAHRIQRLGNDANHKIESRTKKDALELLNLIQIILINNYEMADESIRVEPNVVMK